MPLREERVVAKLKPLSEQVIVITGASSGVGLTIARMAAKRGAAVDCAVCDVGDPQQVAAPAETAIPESGGFDA